MLRNIQASVRTKKQLIAVSMSFLSRSFKAKRKKRILRRRQSSC